MMVVLRCAQTTLEFLNFLQPFIPVAAAAVEALARPAVVCREVSGNDVKAIDPSNPWYLCNILYQIIQIILGLSGLLIEQLLVSNYLLLCMVHWLMGGPTMASEHLQT